MFVGSPRATLDVLLKQSHGASLQLVFTNKRLSLVDDKQGLTGNKVEYHSLPYRNITHFSIETAGHFDLDAELNIWICGSSMPIQKRFNKQLNIYHVQSILAGYVLG